GAVVFRGERLKDLARVLQNGPRSEARRRLLAQVASGASGLRLAEVVIADELPPEQEGNLWTIEDCVARRIAVHMRYHTMERGDASYRHASVHRVVLGDVIRLVGTCHRDDKLKWFRLDNVWWARPDDTESFRSCPHGALAS